MYKLVGILVIAACAPAGFGQTLPVILDVEAQTCPYYYQDVADPSKFATADGPVPVAYTNFVPMVGICDIVAVNGKPAKGTVMIRGTVVWLNPNPGSSKSIGLADVTRAFVMDWHWEIQGEDGGRIGTIHAVGLGGGMPPLGAGEDAMGGTFTVVGGTGAFLGVRGQTATYRQKVMPAPAAREAGISESPRNRRNYPAASIRSKMQLFPTVLPEVIAVFHGDNFSPVTSEKPARAGEVLIASTSGLGPVRPNLELGKAFPASAPGKELYLVNSPLEVTVSGQPAEVRNAIGWPEQTNVYRLDFRVPDGVKPGLASVSLSVAWITGPEVKIPVQ